MTHPRCLLLLCLVGFALVAPVRADVPNNDASLQKLRLAKFVMPEFPSYIELTGTHKGVVTVAIGRDGEGRVTDVFVLDSTNPHLSKSVVGAVGQWKFALPANPAPVGQPIVPIVRFIFSSKGISIVSALTDSLASKDRGIDEKAPVIIPTFAELDAPPKPVNHPMPRFTGSLVDRIAHGGTVTVKFFVDETGKVRVPIVLDASVPELGQAALAAIGEWSFEPPKAAGRETIAIDVETFNFGPPPKTS